jgi:hypothetical protein
MKLINAREAYYEFSGRASDVARQLSFAGLAIVWLSALQNREAADLPPVLTLVTGLLVLGLALDLLQYLYASAAWGILQRVKEIQGVRDDDDFRVPSKINWPTNALHWLKVVPILAAYFFLLRYLFRV